MSLRKRKGKITAAPAPSPSATVQNAVNQQKQSSTTTSNGTASSCGDPGCGTDHSKPAVKKAPSKLQQAQLDNVKRIVALPPQERRLELAAARIQTAWRTRQLNEIGPNATKSFLQALRTGEELKPASSWFPLQMALLLLGFIVLVFTVKVGEAGYDVASLDIADQYAVLGLPIGASSSEVKSAFRALAKEWHPDRNPDCADCSERYTALKEAYDVLTKPHAQEDFRNAAQYRSDRIRRETRWEYLERLEKEAELKKAASRSRAGF